MTSSDLWLWENMWQDDMWSINGTYFVCSSVSLCSELPTCTLPAHQDTQRHTCTHTPSDFFVSRVKSTLITEEAVYCWERPRLCYIIQRVLHFNSEIKQFTQMHKWELIFFFFPFCAGRGEEMTWPGKGIWWTKGRNVPGLLFGAAGMWLPLWEVKLHGKWMCMPACHHHQSQQGPKT